MGHPVIDRESSDVKTYIKPIRRSEARIQLSSRISGKVQWDIKKLEPNVKMSYRIIINIKNVRINKMCKQFL